MDATGMDQKDEPGKASDPGYLPLGLDFVQGNIRQMYRRLNPELTIHDLAVMVQEDLLHIIHADHWIEKATWRNWAQNPARREQVAEGIGYALLELVAMADKLGLSALALLHAAKDEQERIGHALTIEESDERHMEAIVRERAAVMFENWQREAEGHGQGRTHGGGAAGDPGVAGGGPATPAGDDPGTGAVPAGAGDDPGGAGDPGDGDGGSPSDREP